MEKLNIDKIKDEGRLLTPMYRNGYFKALLNFYDFIVSLDNYGYRQEVKTKKKYSNCVKSALKLLLEDSEILDDFMLYGTFGYSGLVIDKDIGVIKRGNFESKDRKD